MRCCGECCCGECCPHSPTKLIAQAGFGAIRRIDTRTNEQVTTLDITHETKLNVLQSPVHRFDSGRRLHRSPGQTWPSDLSCASAPLPRGLSVPKRTSPRAYDNHTSARQRVEREQKSRGPLDQRDARHRRATSTVHQRRQRSHRCTRPHSTRTRRSRCLRSEQPTLGNSRPTTIHPRWPQRMVRHCRNDRYRMRSWRRTSAQLGARQSRNKCRVSGRADDLGDRRATRPKSGPRFSRRPRAMAAYLGRRCPATDSRTARPDHRPRTRP